MTFSVVVVVLLSIVIIIIFFLRRFITVVTIEKVSVSGGGFPSPSLHL